MAKTDQAAPQFHFQRFENASRVTAFNNLRYIMAEYDENVQQWLLKNYPVVIEVPTPARRKIAA